MERKRVVWIDVLNIVACLGVLLLHCNHQTKSYQGDMNLQWLYGLVVYTVAYFPVPVFLMISGYTLIGKTCEGGKTILQKKIRENRYSFYCLEYHLFHIWTSRWSLL